jgi:periplasmic divalent cation tolerance protein
MDEIAELEILSVTTTVGSPQDAQRLALALLERRLAACVQIEPGIRSIYRWQGKIQDEPETTLLVKSLPACERALQRFFDEHHPYEVPEFVAARMTASPSYAAWVRSEVSAPAG